MGDRAHGSRAPEPARERGSEEESCLHRRVRIQLVHHRRLADFVSLLPAPRDTVRLRHTSSALPSWLSLRADVRLLRAVTAVMIAIALAASLLVLPSLWMLVTRDRGDRAVARYGHDLT